MAHLARCWCRRTYRCDIEHPIRTHVCTFMKPMHENNCPDWLLHGPPPPLKIETLTFPVINKVFPTLSANDIVNVQPMTSNNFYKYDMKKCPLCNGTGQYCTAYPKYFSPCGECEGTGKVRTYSDYGKSNEVQ